MASNAKSTPSPCVRSRTAATASTADASIVSVAPNRSAHASFGAATSTAISRSAPAILAPCSAARPIPPRPITATRAPGHTFAVWIAAPTPVETPHPRRHALRSGSSGRHRDRLRRMDDGVRRERAQRERPRERRGVPRPADARRLHPRMGAAARDAAPARPAGAARHRPRQHDGIAHARRVHAVADLLDDAGSLVAEQHRERRSPVPVLDRPEIRVTDPAGDQPNEHLTGPGSVDLEVLDADLAPDRVHHGAERLSRHPSPFTASGSC